MPSLKQTSVWNLFSYLYQTQLTAKLVQFCHTSPIDSFIKGENTFTEIKYYTKVKVK